MAAKKSSELSFEDVKKSFETKSKHFAIIAPYIAQLPEQQYMTCKTSGADNPDRNLVVTCTFNIPFKMRESQFQEWNNNLGYNGKHEILNIIPASIRSDSHTALEVKFDVTKDNRIRFKFSGMYSYVYRKTNEEYNEWLEPAEKSESGETSVYDIISTALKEKSKTSSRRLTEDFEWFKEAVEACVKAMQSDLLRDAYKASNLCTSGRALATL